MPGGGGSSSVTFVRPPVSMVWNSHSRPPVRQVEPGEPPPPHPQSDPVLNPTGGPVKIKLESIDEAVPVVPADEFPSLLEKNASSVVKAVSGSQWRTRHHAAGSKLAAAKSLFLLPLKKRRRRPSEPVAEQKRPPFVSKQSVSRRFQT